MLLNVRGSCLLTVGENRMSGENLVSRYGANQGCLSLDCPSINLSAMRCILFEPTCERFSFSIFVDNGNMSSFEIVFVITSCFDAIISFSYTSIPPGMAVKVKRT